MVVTLGLQKELLPEPNRFISNRKIQITANVMSRFDCRLQAGGSSGSSGRAG